MMYSVDYRLNVMHYLRQFSEHNFSITVDYYAIEEVYQI